MLEHLSIGTLKLQVRWLILQGVTQQDLFSGSNYNMAHSLKKSVPQHFRVAMLCDSVVHGHYCTGLFDIVVKNQHQYLPILGRICAYPDECIIPAYKRYTKDKFVLTVHRVVSRSVPHCYTIVTYLTTWRSRREVILTKSSEMSRFHVFQQNLHYQLLSLSCKELSN